MWWLSIRGLSKGYVGLGAWRNVGGKPGAHLRNKHIEALSISLTAFLEFLGRLLYGRRVFCSVSISGSVGIPHSDVQGPLVPIGLLFQHYHHVYYHMPLVYALVFRLLMIPRTHVTEHHIPIPGHPHQ